MSARPFVLVVEDEPSIAESVCAMLHDSGYSADSVGTLAAARKCIARLRPICVVLDLNLPDGDAEVLLAEIARLSSAPPTVLLSASAQAKRVAARFGVPMVPKPFELDMLVAAVSVAVEGGTRPFDANL